MLLFAGLAGLSTGLIALLVFCLICVFAFEFINGFHDTANAVATVIYTRSLPPTVAVLWSGLFNFMGVLASVWLFGMTVAIKIANLIPIEAILGQDIGQSVALVLAILFSAMAWNLGTWYFGIPCSSSHTLIGAILGAAFVFSQLPENTEQVGVNWDEAKKIGSSLLLSPAFGFTMAIALMFSLRAVLLSSNNKDDQNSKNKEIFKEPSDNSEPPPLWIRSILIFTCTLVSFFHGSNDGQKGVGLALIVLICFLPMEFALSPDFNVQKVQASLQKISAALPTSSDPSYSTYSSEISKAKTNLEDISSFLPLADTDIKSRLKVRKRLMLLKKDISTILATDNIIADPDKRKTINTELKTYENYTHYVPFWVLLMISLALGVGTTIGWKRIVKTIGEKIGKRHMTYAEGATAEVIAATTIGLASFFGLPVSTTHVLSSGVAGAMVATKGTKNLNQGTIINIVLAWVLTLPVTILLSGALFLLFRAIF